jgi:hypothetical protein
MTLTPLQKRNQQRIERLRGWIINILYVNRPDPCELSVISDTLDGYNMGCSRRALAGEIELLRTLRLVRVFPLGSGEDISNIQQAQLIQRYANSDNDQELHMTLCASLTARGNYFQEGLESVTGVARIQ